MSQVLVISGHPDLSASYTNTVIINELKNQIDDIEVRRLDSLYPDYQIDIQAEQQALVKADVVILQFPFYWYSVPALMKKWIDDVFAFNFAFGPEGDKLKGKELILSFTIGGPAESYDPLSYNHFTIEEMLRPLQQLAYLANMNYSKPIYTHRMVYIPNIYNELEEVQSLAREHTERLVSHVYALTHSPESIINKFVAQWFSKFDVLPEQSDTFTQHLSKDIKLTMPEGEFNGHEGFRDWYQIARNTFKPNCQHIIEQVDVKNVGETYKVELRIRLLADTKPDSVFKGDSINLLVNETWGLKIDSQGKVNIKNYLVTPVIS